MKKRDEMHQKGESSFSYDESEIIVIAEDESDWDYPAILLDAIPSFRNDYAHGSSQLHNGALRSFEIVSEFINQLYPVEKQ